MALEAVPKTKTNGNNNFNEALELEHLIGMTCNYTNSFLIHPIDINKYIYSIGPTLIIDEFTNEHNQILLKKHDTRISCINISKCGTMIASGQYGSNLLKNTAIVNLWDFNKLILIHSFNGLLNGVNKILFTPDSKFLIAIDLNGLFIIWDTKTFETIFAKQIIIDKKIINIDSIEILNVIKDSNQFGKHSKHNIYKILVSYSYNLYEWTLIYSVKHMEYILYKTLKFAYPSNRSFNRILTHLTKICIDIGNNINNNFLIAATTNIGEIYLFDSKHNVYSDSFQVCSCGANVSCFINKYNILIGGGDGSLKQFYFDYNKTKTWILIKDIKLDSSINTLQLINENDNILYVYVTTIQSNVYKIDISISNIKQTLIYKSLFKSPFCPIYKVIFGKYNHIFATLTSINGILTIWDLSNYSTLGEIKNNNQNNGTALTFYNETKILTGFDNGTIICNNIDFINNGRDTKIIWEIKNAHRGKVNCISIICASHNKKSNNILLLSGGDDGLLNIWNYETKQLISQYHIMIECIFNIIQDKKYKAMIHLLGSNAQIATFSLKREDIIIRRMIKDIDNKKNNFGKITCLIQNNCNEYELISCTSNGYILIWDHELTQLINYIDCKKIINLKSITSLHILTCALSNNAKYLCIANNIGQIFIICMKTKKLITNNNIHTHSITSVAWTPDDKQIITSSADSSIAVSNFYT
eukprot:4005_1